MPLILDFNQIGETTKLFLSTTLKTPTALTSLLAPCNMTVPFGISSGAMVDFTEVTDLMLAASKTYSPFSPLDFTML